MYSPGRGTFESMAATSSSSGVIGDLEGMYASAFSQCGATKVLWFFLYKQNADVLELCESCPIILGAWIILWKLITVIYILLKLVTVICLKSQNNNIIIITTYPGVERACDGTARQKAGCLGFKLSTQMRDSCGCMLHNGNIILSNDMWTS